MNVTEDSTRGAEHRAVVVGVDGTPLALHAVRWAAAEAVLRGRPLEILHGAPYATVAAGPGRRRAKYIIARAYTVARRTQPDLTVTTRFTTANPARCLLDAGDSAELVVVGMGGGDQPQEVLLGSTALDVAGRARCPVVVVRGRHRVHSSTRPVLVGVDSLEHDATAIALAFTDARRHRRGLTVLHARHGTTPTIGKLAGHAEAARVTDRIHLADALQPWAARFPDVPVELRVVHGHPTPALLTAAITARLLVLSTRGRGALARALFGSTSREVLRRSPVPVEVVNPEIVIRDDEPVPTANRNVTGADGMLVLSSSASENPHDRSQLC